MVKGPGPFTAVRIAIALANTFSYALNIPVFGIKFEENKVNSVGREGALGHKTIEELIKKEISARGRSAFGGKNIKNIKPGEIVKPIENV